MDNKTILATITGEFFQPVRLHYQVFDGQGLLQAFQKLRSVKHDPERQRWVWLYDDEAKSLEFKHSYAQIGEDFRPIVLGSFTQRTKDSLLLDLRSCERAKLAIPFFDKHIPRQVAKVTVAEIANRLFSTDNRRLSPEDVFAQRPSDDRDPKAEFEKLANLIGQAQGIRGRFDAAMKAIRSASSRSLPEIERLPVHYYEDGMQGFELALSVRQIVAMQHWRGNSKYTLFDAIQAITKSK